MVSSIWLPVLNTPSAIQGADPVAVVIELEQPLVGAHAGRTFGVADVEADHVAARKVELRAASQRPPVLCFGMAVVDDVGGAIIGAAGVMQSRAHARKPQA